MKQLAIIATVAVLAAPASAEFVDGNKLYRICYTSLGSPEYGHCLGYIMGISDALEMVRSGAHLGPCVGAAPSFGQIVDVTRAYLHNHPEKRHWSAATLTVAAITDAFCPSDNSSMVSRIPEQRQPQWNSVPAKKPGKPLPLDTE